MLNFYSCRRNGSEVAVLLGETLDSSTVITRNISKVLGTGRPYIDINDNAHPIILTMDGSHARIVLYVDEIRVDPLDGSSEFVLKSQQVV